MTATPTWTRGTPPPPPTEPTDTTPEAATEAPALPTIKDITDSVSQLSGRTEELQRDLDRAKHRFLDRAGVSGNVSDDVRDTVWQEHLPSLREDEDAVLASARNVIHELTEARTAIADIDAAEDIPTEVYKDAASITPFVSQEIAFLTGTSLVRRLHAIASRGDRAQILAWRHAAREWLQAHDGDRARAQVERVIHDMGDGFKARRSGDLTAAQEQALAKAMRIESTINQARQNRGELPDWLQGVFPGKPAASGTRVTGYETA